jgi:cell division protein FtsW
MVYSASYIYAEERFHDGLYFFKRHMVFSLLGVGAFLAGSRVPMAWLKRMAFPFLGLCTVLVLATLIPGLGRRAGGAARWLVLGPLGLQPAELLKAAVLLFVAAQLERKEGERQNWRTGFLAYFAAALPAYVLLLLQPDFGSTILLLATTTLVLLATGIRVQYIATMLAGTATAGALLILTSPYRRARVEAFLDPWKDAAGKGFQVIQSLVAVYSGSWLGVGLGNSKEKLFYLPEAHNDFIFAVVAEELGVFGILFFTGIFLTIVLRGLKAAAASRTTFERGLALGISVMIGLQAFFNIGVVLGLLPTKGLPLPLVSYGGTSLIVTMLQLGVLTQLAERGART